MHPMTGSIRRLYTRGAEARGLVVDADGVMLGPDHVLVRRDGDAYEPLSRDAASRLLEFTFDAYGDPDWLLRPLGSIARALGAGDLLKAQLLGLLIPLDVLDRRQLVRLAIAADLAKEGFDPNQPRDELGRWTTEGGASTSMAGRAATAALGLWAGRAASLGRILSVPTVVLGGLFVPGNWARTGTLPGRSEISYRYAEGQLWLYRTGDDGMRRTLFSGVPGLDGVYRDEDGKPIGRKAGTGFIVDTAALVGEAPVGDDDEPRLCPDPGPDTPHGASPRSIRYQTQITGLPPGIAVWLNGVAFDGCRESDGTMLEAKGPGYERVLEIGGGKLPAEAYDDAVGQARRQLIAAGSRRLEWHVAEKSAADYLRTVFEKEGIGETTVINTPAEDNQ